MKMEDGFEVKAINISADGILNHGEFIAPKSGGKASKLGSTKMKLIYAYILFG
jgi:hypothetical protein